MPESIGTCVRLAEEFRLHSVAFGGNTIDDVLQPWWLLFHAWNTLLLEPDANRSEFEQGNISTPTGSLKRTGAQISGTRKRLRGPRRLSRTEKVQNSEEFRTSASASGKTFSCPRCPHRLFHKEGLFNHMCVTLQIFCYLTETKIVTALTGLHLLQYQRRQETIQRWMR